MDQREINEIDRLFRELLALAFHPSGKKVCRRCKESKALAEFGRYSSRREGIHYYCKTCVTSRTAEYYRENTEQVRMKRREYGKSEAGMAVAARHEAKRVGRSQTPAIKKYKSERNQRQKKALTDHYVSLILRMPLSKAPKALIEAKRKLIEIKNFLKDNS